MKVCDECGLPMDACSALAMYRKAVEEYGRGRKEEGDRHAEGAKEFYDSYRLKFSLPGDMDEDGYPVIRAPGQGSG